MKKILPILLIATLLMLFYQCGNTQKESTTEDQSSYDSMVEENWQHDSILLDKARKEALDYQKSIVDNTFLQTKGTMSEEAISPFIGSGWNYDLTYNEVVYMAALERAKKHLSVKDNQLVLNLKSGAEINITEDLYQFITDLFVDWNTWIEEGRFKIIQTKEGYYDIEPVRNNEGVD